MPALGRATFLLGILLFGVTAGAQTQSPPKESKATGFIAGRITVDGKPKSGIEITAQPQSLTVVMPWPSATTDEDGRFLLTGIEPGHYWVYPRSRIHVSAGRTAFRQGVDNKALILAEGETVEGIDFALETGGIITGRVTDAEGRPLVDELVTLTHIIETERGGTSQFRPLGKTDDSGVYRFYALPAGRYILSAGGPSDMFAKRRPDGRPAYSRTYHPNVADEAQAKVIELAPGTEAAKVDIKLGPPIRLRTIAGRLIDAETGSVVPNGLLIFGPLREDSSLARGDAYRSDGKGEFRIEGFLPGRYAIFAKSDEQSGFYSEPVTIVMSEEDISGVELRLLRGASISGRAVIERTGDSAPSKLPQLSVSVSPSVPGLPHWDYSAGVRFDADGNFLVRGLPGGKARFNIIREFGLEGFTLLRVERGGGERGINLAPNEQVTDVRVVFAYGAEIVRGQIKVEGGELPKGAYIRVAARRIRHDGADRGPITNARVDSRGHFTLEGMTIGDHELTLIVENASMPTRPIKHLINVAKGKENNIILTLTLGAKADSR
jgi:hypothetical protein